MGFYAAIPVFHGFPSHILMLFLRHSKQRPMKKDQWIYRDGDAMASVFVVKEGEIELSKEVMVYSREEFDEERDVGSIQELEKLSKQLRNCEFEQMNARARGKHDKMLFKRLKFSILSNGCLFGESELFSSKSSKELIEKASDPNSRQNRKDFLHLLAQFKLFLRKTQAKVVSNHAELMEIPLVPFLDIYLSYVHNLRKLQTFAESREKWQERFIEGYKGVVKEKQHEDYRLTHQRDRLGSLLRGGVEKGKRRTLLEERVGDWLVCSSAIIAKYEENEGGKGNMSCFYEGNEEKKGKTCDFPEESNEKIGKSSTFHEETNRKRGKSSTFHEESNRKMGKSSTFQMNSSQKKLKTGVLWSVGTRSKSEERTMQVTVNKIKRMGAKKHEDSGVSLNLKGVLEDRNLEALKRGILFKRMRVDSLFAGEGISVTIGSLFKKNEKNKQKKLKMTSFQTYIAEKRAKSAH